MTESQYNELPTWQKEGMLPCICGGATALFYDENENYRVECCKCKKITLFKAKSMKEAKEHWKTSPNCLGANDFVGRKEREGNMENQNRYIELAKHCIGLSRKKPYTRHGKKFYRPYRNYFATGKGPDLEDWEMMKSAGYADKLKQNQHGEYKFYLTRDGLDWLGEQLGIHIYDKED